MPSSTDYRIVYFLEGTSGPGQITANISDMSKSIILSPEGVSGSFSHSYGGDWYSDVELKVTNRDNIPCSLKFKYRFGTYFLFF